jgi:hypothetical protein
VTGGKAVRPTADDRRTQDAIAGVLNAHDPQETAARARTMREERAAYSRRLVESAYRFPTYEVPPEVAERFPEFDPANPETWPEPGKCTEGRPWGLDAYGNVWGDWPDRWRSYLTDRTIRNRCRNRWRSAETRLCGTHENSYRATVAHEAKRHRENTAYARHVDLAKRLDEHGIEATGTAAGVVLSGDTAEEVLELLASYERANPLGP